MPFCWASIISKTVIVASIFSLAENGNLCYTICTAISAGHICAVPCFGRLGHRSFLFHPLDLLQVIDLFHQFSLGDSQNPQFADITLGIDAITQAHNFVVIFK